MQIENLPRWDQARKGFYEVWYFKLNLGPGAPALWLRLTTLSSKGGNKKIAETWGVFFDVQGANPRHVAVKESYPAEAFSFSDGRLSMGPCHWKDGKTAGKIASHGSEISWDLSFNPNAAGFSHVPRLFEKLKLNKTTVITPNPDLRFSGSFQVNGKKYSCDGAPGMQGHIFGVQSGLGWAWAHANISDDAEPFVFEGLTATIKLGGLVKSPPLSAFFFKAHGKIYEFNSVRDALMIKSSYSLSGWEFFAEMDNVSFHGKITSRPADMAGVTYEDTDGSFLYCHNSKVASLDLAIKETGSKRVIKSTGVCAFELVTRQKDPRVGFLL